MCTLAVYFRASAEFPLVIAANRDEFYARATAPPACLENVSGRSWIFAGRDLVARGTWLGLNSHGLVAALLNRRTGSAPDPSRRSRGLLCLEALRHDGVPAAAASVCGERADDFNPFHLLLADEKHVWAASNADGRMRVRRLAAGVHVFTNREPNDPLCPRVAKSRHLFRATARHLRSESLEEFLATVREVLADHSYAVDPAARVPPENLCVHTPVYGTRSSTILAYSAAAKRFLAWHAEGPPCSTPHTRIPLPEPLPEASERLETQRPGSGTRRRP